MGSPAVVPQLQVLPQTVQFSDVDSDQQLCTTVTIKNLDCRQRLLRWKAPKTTLFHVQGLATVSKLAPGLQLSFKVLYKGPSGHDAHDSFTLMMDNGAKVEVPCHALQPRSKLRVKGDLAVGFVALDSVVQRSLHLSNSGLTTASFRVEVESGLPIQVTPADGKLNPKGAPGSTCSLKVELTAEISGPLSGKVSIYAEDQTEPVSVDCTATIVSSTFEMMDSQGAVMSQVDFGALHYGDNKQVSFSVLNNGPKPARFFAACGTPQQLAEETDATTPRDDPMTAFIQAARVRSQQINATGTKLFEVVPLSGVIPAYSRATLTAVFKPVTAGRVKGFQATALPSDEAFTYACQLSFDWSAQELKCSLKGLALEPRLSVSHPQLLFGEVASHDWADQNLVLANQGSTLPLQFRIQPSPYFHCLPDQGSMAPGANSPLVVRFCPKALGRHQASLAVQVLSEHANKVIAEVPFKALGLCRQLGEHHGGTLPGGPLALPETFAKPRQFVDPDKAMTQTFSKGSPYKRPAVWEQPDVLRQFQEHVLETTKNAFSLEDTKRRVAHNSSYVSFMRKGRTAKEQADATRNETDDNVNLGMHPYRGMVGPERGLRPGKDPLWLDMAAVHMRPANRPDIPADAVDAIPMFKDKPTSDEEQEQCSCQLTAQAVSQVAVGPRLLDFGKVSAASRNVRYLAVSNPLVHSIHVVLALAQLPELNTTEPVSQVIPAGSTAKFPIVFSDSRVQHFQQTVEYVVNGCHIFTFQVRASVVAVTLDLTEEELFFQFGMDNWSAFVDQVFMLSNPQPIPASYKWVLAEGADPSVWSVTPASGQLGGPSTEEVTVRWTPKPNAPPGETESSMRLEVVGGDSVVRQVRLKALLPEGKLVFSSKALDLGGIPVGVAQTSLVTLKNTGLHDAMFQVLPSELVRCNPDRGRVPQGGTLDMELTLSCMESQSVNTQVLVEVRGGKPVKLVIKGEAVLPAVDIQERQLDFGEVYMGVTARIPVTIINTTPVLAGMSVDLQAQPSFSLDLPKENWSPDEYEDCPLIRLGRRGSAGSSRSSRRNKVTEAEELSRLIEGARYQLKLLPNKSLTLWLLFTARKEATYNFELPISLLGYGFSVAGVSAVNRTITARAVEARLSLSKTMLDFGSQIVLRSNQVKPPYSLDVLLTSNEEGDIAWQMGLPSCEGLEGYGGVFAVEPNSGTLAKNARCLVKVKFSPKDSRIYEAKVPLFLGGNTAQPYYLVDVRGEGQYPRLKFDTKECIMPPVPLGFTSKAQFYVISQGYDNLQLKIRPPPDEQHLPLTFDFPEGSLIGIAKEKLPVIVGFTGSRPTSFTANVVFLDEEGKRFSLPITGTTDASLLTTKSFMDVNGTDLVWSSSTSGPPQLDPRGSYKLPEGGFASMGPTVSPVALSKFLTAVSGKQFQNPPSEMLVSRGLLIHDLLELFSGKPMPGRTSGGGSGRRESAPALLAGYENLLAHLKSQNALLNAVKPELLLDITDFRLILAKREAKAVTEADTEALDWWYDLEDDFELLSFKAWNAVIYQTIDRMSGGRVDSVQVVRVFVLARVTVRSLKSLPGLEGCQLPPDNALLNSNVYSTAETVLLAWITAHYHKALPTVAQRVTNFDSDLCDGLALAALLISHWPELASFVSQLKLSPGNQAGMRYNAGSLVKMMEELQLPWTLQEDEITKPDSRDMVLLVLYLYQTLPQLLPRTTLDFAGKLGDKQTRSIELSAQGSKAMVYSARLIGHPDFSLEATTVRVEPGSSASFAVQCKASTTNPQTAKLVLVSKRGVNGAPPAAPLAFALRGEVDARGPLKRIKTSAQLYEFQEVEVKLTNPFQVDCDFSIRVVHASAADLDLDRLRGPEAKNSGTSRGQKKPRPDGKEAGSSAKGKVFPKPFGIDRQRIRIKANAEETLKGAFLPFTLGQHTCSIIFEDASCGKFVYEVTGDTSLPQPFNKFRFQVAGDGPQTRDISLPWNNSQIDAARRTFLDRHPLAKNKEQVALAKGEGEAISASVSFSVEKNSSRIEVPEAFTLHRSTMPKSEAPAPAAAASAAAGPPALTRKLSNSLRESAEPAVTNRAPGPDGAPLNNLRVILHPVGAGTYPSKVVLTSGGDVRVLDVEFIAVKTGQQVMLEFNSPARDKLVQEVPVVNKSSQVVHVTADLRGGEAFSGPKDLMVGAGQTAVYPLTFRAPWIGDYVGNLDLNFPETEEKNQYTLVGKASHPIAEAHLQLACQARTHLAKKVAVPNLVPKNEAYYKVYSDLDCLGGKEGVQVTPGGTGGYTMHILAPRPGVFNGSITFMAESGHYVWYSLQLNVSEAPPIGSLDVSAAVRQAVAVQVQISNPLHDALTFDLTYGSDQLVGPEVLALKPKESRDFEFFFAPLVEGASQASVTFSSFRLGNFSYKVNMHADPAEAQTIPQLQACLGSTARHILELQNPVGTEVVLQTSCSNPHNFTLSTAAVVLSPYGQAEVAVDYLPSSLGTSEEGVVSLYNEEVGMWEYNLSGVGVRPGMMDPTCITATLGSDGSSFVSWRNPFVDPVKVDVTLLQQAEEPAADESRFELVLKKLKGIAVGSFGILQIPISFKAQSLEESTGEVQIVMDGAAVTGQTLAEPLLWQYPIKGLPEAEASGEVFKYSCQARSRLESSLELRLEGLGKLTGAETFTHDFTIPASKQSALKNALQLVPQFTTVTDPTQPLRYKVIFEPQKTFSAKVQLVVEKSTGGRWRFELRLEATQPDVDGSVTIQAAPGQSALGPVMLYSPADQPEPFTCHFTHDSSISFDVSPSEGVLPVRPTPGQAAPQAPIMVKYFAKGYGKTQIGKLVILTEDQQWTYIIRGEQPTYQPPDKSRMSIHFDNQIDPEMNARLQSPASRISKSFLVRNMMVTKTSRQTRQ
ncbi:TPA: putative protein fap47 [Trebouxia sp. C0004]